MAYSEVGLFNHSRRDLILAFASKRKGSTRLQQTQRVSSPNPSPEPSGGDGLISRQTGIIAVGLTAGALVVFLTKPWEFFSEDRSQKEWVNTPPKERLRRLEFLQYPRLSVFDPQREMVKAVSEYYCQKTVCKKSPVQLQESTLITNTERVIEEIELENNRRLTPAEKAPIQKNTIEIFGAKRGLVLLAQENLQKEVRAIINNNPALVGNLEGRDLYSVLFRGILFHGYTHADADLSEFPIQPITVPSANPITLDRIGQGFTFFGKRETGEQIFVTGGNEAIVEYIATYLSQDVGPHLSPPAYLRGVRIIELINLAAGLPVETFMEYNSGRRTKSELFKVWGALRNRAQPDEHAATQALLTVGLLVNSPLNIQQAPFIDKVNELLKLS